MFSFWIIIKYFYRFCFVQSSHFHFFYSRGIVVHIFWRERKVYDIFNGKCFWIQRATLTTAKCIFSIVHLRPLLAQWPLLLVHQQRHHDGIIVLHLFYYEHMQAAYLQ